MIICELQTLTTILLSLCLYYINDIPTLYILAALGCNIPALCPVTLEGQIRCSGCEPSESHDDGLCCPGD